MGRITSLRGRSTFYVLRSTFGVLRGGRKRCWFVVVGSSVRGTVENRRELEWGGRKRCWFVVVGSSAGVIVKVSANTPATGSCNGVGRWKFLELLDRLVQLPLLSATERRLPLPHRIAVYLRCHFRLRFQARVRKDPLYIDPHCRQPTREAVYPDCVPGVWPVSLPDVLSWLALSGAS